MSEVLLELGGKNEGGEKIARKRRVRSQNSSRNFKNKLKVKVGQKKKGCEKKHRKIYHSRRQRWRAKHNRKRVKCKFGRSGRGGLVNQTCQLAALNQHDQNCWWGHSEPPNQAGSSVTSTYTRSRLHKFRLIIKWFGHDWQNPSVGSDY